MRRPFLVQRIIIISRLFFTVMTDGSFRLRKPGISRPRRKLSGGRKDRRSVMRFIHIADVHLGACPDAGKAYTEQRPEEIWNTFEHIIRICQAEQTDLLLIAGDLFHRQPLLRELKEVDYLFSTLTHTKVVLIAGNHDYIRRDSYYRTFRWHDNVYPLFGREIRCVEFDGLQTAVYGLSYYSREITEPLYHRAAPEGRQRYEILLAHGGDEKHIPINWEELERSGFSYTALGHIHKPQAVRRNRIVYAGALEPVDRNDTGPHGYVKGELTGKGNHISWIPCASREYIHLEVLVDERDTAGSVKQKIRKLIHEYGNENIYKIKLKGERDRDILLDSLNPDDLGNILEVTDETRPAYDFDRLYRENADNLIGRYIESFAGCSRDSEAYQALCEGVDALLANRR